MRFFKTYILPQALILGFLFSLECHKSITDPEIFFVGGPENPASDGSYTERIYSENGIASLEEIELGGAMQWILIRGYDTSNPLLIFLHGGPGSACIFYAKYAFGGIEENFTVVTWDQRGCGKSYNENIDPNTLTYDQLHADTHELIQKMMQRFGVDKIFLMGLSWGSVLGINMATQYPELLHAYIGAGQVVHTQRGAHLALQKTLEKANELNDPEAIDTLSQIPDDETILNHTGTISYYLEKYGFGDIHNLETYNEILPIFIATPEYTEENRSNDDAWEALYRNAPVYTDNDWFIELDYISQITSLQIPVYFLAGRYDYKTPSSLVEEFYNNIQAPKKNMFWFDNSAHIPFLEERAPFHASMINTILPEVLD